MKNKFFNKNVVITGGSSGIGLALAKKYVEEKANVWILARNETNLIKATEVLKKMQGGNVDYAVVDVTNLKDLQKFVDLFHNNNLSIDYLINSAGVAYPGELINMDLEKFHWLMDINYFGTVNVIKLFLPLLQKGSHIINISSMAGLLGVYGYTAYGASKYAVRGFSDALRSEFKSDGIQLSIVYPPDTDTPQLAFENQFKPEITKEIAGSAGALSAEKVADSILKGIKRKQYVIIPGLESNLIYHATNILGKLIYPLMDIMVSSAERKIRNNQSISDL
jgi:3-dehydrosphinganine reductase